MTRGQDVGISCQGTSSLIFKFRSAEPAPLTAKSFHRWLTRKAMSKCDEQVCEEQNRWACNGKAGTREGAGRSR